MRICRFNDNRVGVVRGDKVHDVTSILDRLEPVRYPAPIGDRLITNLEAWRPELEKLADKAQTFDAATVRFLSPVANPSKIIGVPTNYLAHRQEMAADTTIQHRDRGEQTSGVQTVLDQGFFLKANSSLVGPSEGVKLRFPNRRNDHEAELGLIIGKRGSDIAEKDALDYVVGYAMALDMVVRGKEDRSFRKSIDTYSVLGPWLVTKDEIADPETLDFNLKVNDEVRQKSNTSDMIMKVRQQIALASSFYTLLPGDIIMTGTCSGVGRVAPGDVMTFEMQGIGTMKIPVMANG
jgi:2-keto-4-pentenoate hydratase/2-oxohepta-3-ene-1,7-dioic acid hydratase in catechol pathway